MELRTRVIAAYEAGEGGYILLARRFKLGEATVKRWVWRFKKEGIIQPKKKSGGTPSIVNIERLEGVLSRLGDANAGEITVEYNRYLRGEERHHVSSIKRALHRAGFVVKKSVSGHLSSCGPTSSKSARSSLKSFGAFQSRSSSSLTNQA